MPSINDSKYVLVIGATSGIGKALALAIHKLPTKPTVIVAGRRQERLDEIVSQGAREGRLEAIQVDVSAKADDLKKFVANVTEKYPDLDSIIFAAGIQHIYDFKKPEEINIEVATEEFNVNYNAIFALITFFLPHLFKLGESGRPGFLVPISSGLAIVPLGNVSNYCASKAALHSLCLSLRTSLKDTNVHVMEILPPLVESELHDHQGTTPMLAKFWMPLDEYIKHTMEGLQNGDFNIVTPAHKSLWEKFERDKIDIDARKAFSNVRSD